MHKCYRLFVKGGALEQQDKITVLDVGAADVNGSFRQIFNDPKFHYLTADIAAAPGFTTRIISAKESQKNSQCSSIWPESTRSTDASSSGRR